MVGLGHLLDHMLARVAGPDPARAMAQYTPAPGADVAAAADRRADQLPAGRVAPLLGPGAAPTAATLDDQLALSAARSRELGRRAAGPGDRAEAVPGSADRPAAGSATLALHRRGACDSRR